MDTDQVRENLKIVTGKESPEKGSTIREALAQLDAFAKNEALPRDLLHYLSRRSYVKALEWLDHPDMPHKP